MSISQHVQREIARYDTVARDAYAEYAEALASTGRSPSGRMDPVAMENGAMLEEVRRVGGRLGAKLSAASKAAMRSTLFAALEEARREGADVTPTVALHAAERVIGRGVSMRAANAAFGRPGRTAADKTSLEPAELAELEAKVRQEIQHLRDELGRIRDHHRQRWRDSPQRDALLQEWRAALGGASIKPLLEV